MRWADLDLEADKPLWSIPREFVKVDRAHYVPLAPEAVAILKDLPRHQGAHVFTTGDGTVPISSFTTAKRRVDKKMIETMREAAEQAGDDPETVELPRWTLHDLRRTAATNMAVLNHSPGGTHGITAIYVRFRYDDERRQALEAWARRLDQIVTRAAPDNVVPIHETV